MRDRERPEPVWVVKVPVEHPPGYDGPVEYRELAAGEPLPPAIRQSVYEAFAPLMADVLGRFHLDGGDLDDQT
jgi:hypothetical protein